MSTVALLLLVVVAVAVQQASCLVRLDLTQSTWQLSNSNRSIRVPTKLPAHVLGVLASAGVVQQDPLYRFGELHTRWVAEDTWNFTVIWPGQQHEQVTECKQVLLVLHGLDTFAHVVLNGQHVLAADNAHRSWWLPLPAKSILRAGANLLSVVIQPALTAALRTKAQNPYAIPTMKVPGGFDVYNFARKPASDFGWDWGPAFAPAGITGSIELIGFNRATLIGAMVDQQLVNSSTFMLTTTAQFLVPEAGDTGQLTVSLPGLQLSKTEKVQLKAGIVAGNTLQALAILQLAVPADCVALWQPIGRLPKGQRQSLYDLQLTFQPQGQPSSGSVSADDASRVTRRIGFRRIELVQQPVKEAAAELIPTAPTARSSSSTSSSGGGSGSSSSETEFAPAAGPGAPAKGVTAASRDSTGVTRGKDVTSDTPTGPVTPQQTGDAKPPATAITTSTPLQQQWQQQWQQQQKERTHELEGESFYFKVNGVPLYAKGANLIPLHVLSTAVTDDNIVRLLQAAAAAHMNMVRIWGGGLYQRDVLYDAADELGLLIWQEAMFACSPYPRGPAFLSDVESEVAQQLLRLGSHPSIVLWGGNNEVEASLEWYNETRGNLALFAVDYEALFVGTIGGVVQRMLPGVAWVDSSPSNGYLNLGHLPPDQISLDLDNHKVDQPDLKPGHHPLDQISQDLDSGKVDQLDLNTGPTGQAAAPRIKRWGNPQDPKYGDVHFYNYKDDCQDWRTYPAARFISEYGWQSYPTWPTYKAATSAQDWAVDSAMTEFRQRHPNGTVELLAQLQRRFKLPQSWLQLLPQSPTANTIWSTSSILTFEQLHFSWDTVSLVGRWWRAIYRAWRQLTNKHQHQQQQPSVVPASSSSGSGGGGSEAADMQHYIYLSQLQQMLCYDTSLSYWRRLRSNSSVLTMGVLYWQLNDIWQGASWSSIDYGGVWKPLHYGVARSFADLSLSVQHDLHNDTIQVHVVSDLGYAAQVEVTIRLLSLQDSAENCNGSSSSNESSSYSQMLQQQQQQDQRQAHGNDQHDHQQQEQQSAVCASTPWSKYCHVTATTVPPASAVHVWSSTLQQLLSAAAGCTRQSCYVHTSLTAAAATQQDVGRTRATWLDQQLLSEATVFMAPFKQMNLPEPDLQLSDFQVLNDVMTNNHRGGSSGSTDSSAAGSATASTGDTVKGSTIQGSTLFLDESSTSPTAADHAEAVQANTDIVADSARHGVVADATLHTAADATLHTAADAMQRTASDSAQQTAAGAAHRTATGSATHTVADSTQYTVHQKFLADAAGVVQFTVSSRRVAVYAVWELRDQKASSLLPGHFSDNVVTVHPCEPRTVQFIPSLGTAGIRDYLQKVQQQQQQQGWQQQQGQVHNNVQQYSVGKAEVASSTGSTPDAKGSMGRANDVIGSTDNARGAHHARDVHGDGGQLLAVALQRNVVASSLYDHQQFAADTSQSRVDSS